jgi:hypothetical protein
METFFPPSTFEVAKAPCALKAIELKNTIESIIANTIFFIFFLSPFFHLIHWETRMLTSKQREKAAHVSSKPPLPSV